MAQRETPYLTEILRIDLERKKTSIEAVGQERVRKYIGGSGLGAEILWRETGPNIAPLSPGNNLLFMVGPLTGIVPLGSRYVVCALSPATGGWGEARGGGGWPTELRRTGFSGILIQGRADRPVYLYLDNREAEIRDASHLWGKDTYEVSDILRQETDDRAKVAAIGQAGENLVRIAGIISEGRLGRAAARGGMGAIMGSKNLKAVVVRGTMKPPVADQAGLKSATQEFLRRLTRIKAGDFGPMPQISASVPHLQEIGSLPVKNWTGVKFDSFVEKMSSFEEGKRLHCHSCPIGCLESFFVPGGERRQMTGHHIMPVGANCFVDDLEALQTAYDLCNKYGMDSISVGACISFAMECFEKGALDSQATGGLQLTWGNSQALLELVRQMGEARGLGKVLGQGVKRAAEEIGGQSHLYAMHVKGLEMQCWDPRAYNSLWIGLATASMGPNHMEARSHALEREAKAGAASFGLDGTDQGYPRGTVSRLGFEGKAKMVKKMQDFTSIINALIICDFAFFQYGLKLSQSLEWLNAITGWEMALQEYWKAGERIFDLKRRLNLRQGLTARDDTLPARFFSPRPEMCGREGIPASFADILQEYYAERGWSREGVPQGEGD